jgi:hypothetical protein
MLRFRNPLMVLVLAVTTRVFAQTPTTQTSQPNIGDALALPPGPTVTDWQPRGRGVVGMRIVVTGPSFRPADVVAVIGGSKIPLPVRLATSTSTRIELDVPASAMGQTGVLAIGHKGTRGTVLETAYVIDAMRPALVSTAPRTGAYPFAGYFLPVEIKEFTGATAINDAMTIAGTCGFKRSPIASAPRQRNSDFVITMIVTGWFEQPGNCQLQLNVTPIAANGTSLPTVNVTVPVSVPAPVQYVFDNTAQFTTLFAPTLVHSGLGSTCSANPGAPGATGVTSIGSDLQILIRGGLTDQSCTFQTAVMALGSGVRLVEMRWRSSVTGDRCGRAGTFSPTLPSSGFTMTRGSVLVNPTTTQPATAFFVFGRGNIVVDGVTLMTVQQPTTALLAMVIDLQCVSMAVPLVTATGVKPPTTSPQSFGAVLDRIVLQGPPGLTIEQLIRRF